MFTNLKYGILCWDHQISLGSPQFFRASCTNVVFIVTNFLTTLSTFLTRFKWGLLVRLCWRTSLNESKGFRLFHIVNKQVQYQINIILKYRIINGLRNFISFKIFDRFTIFILFFTLYRKVIVILLTSTAYKLQERNRERERKIMCVWERERVMQKAVDDLDKAVHLLLDQWQLVAATEFYYYSKL